ncbi:flagellar assembly peptidoglycan hydrolase FlgJ [Ferrimonas senticii]|uniref:flagellar assembly peptidoglycan hydrolase FlgJ n=1 Tax=Ferrimonas senticii TaxID=394566 RepID=UPI000418256E|nr:flagellar assembly peptidoglycan hydrolase FlgJ [Ferrimonas senticii]
MSSLDSRINQSSHYLDLASIDKLRQQAQADPEASLRQVAQQFEGIFLGMMLKSMREANESFKDADSPFHSNQTDFYQQMHDSQLVTEMSNQGSLGLAELIVQQLRPTLAKPEAAAANSDAPTATTVTELAMPPRPIKAVAAVADKSTVAASSLEVIADSDAVDNSRAMVVEPLYFSQPQQFIEAMLPAATDAGKKLGQDPRLLVAQAALETGWGQKILSGAQGQSSHNLFNIKADGRWQGPTTAVSALEYQDGLPVLQRSKFRVYDSLKASFDDYVQFLQQPRYQQALTATTAEGFAVALQQAGYATDPKYAAKIINLFQRLTQQPLNGQ